MTLHVVTFLWRPPAGYRSRYKALHANILYNMVRRNYHADFQMHCVTDLPEDGFDNDIQLHPLWDDHGKIPNPHGPHNPSCYRRLRLWAPDGAGFLYPGARVLQIDLDMVIVGDVTPLWQRPEPVVFWEDQLNRHNKINGAMQLFTAAARTGVWLDFDPNTSPAKARAAGNWGSDQAWLSYYLADDWARWTANDGAYSWRVHCLPAGGALPKDARIVNFHGATDPEHVRSGVPWVAAHYR